MHLVDEIDLVAAARRGVLDVVEKVPRFGDFRARRRVDLDQVDEAALVDLAAGRALAARDGRDAALAVERLREHARHRRLADAARPREEERVMQAAAVERVDEGAHDVLLTGDVAELPGPPLARENEIAHRNPVT